MDRRGITAAGNWIIDQVKIVDKYPQEDHLATILNESTGTGGCAYNTLIGLRMLDDDIPLQGIGVVGEDSLGQQILTHMDRLHIDRGFIRKSPLQPTSYTDVMTVESTGRRTFFHNRGANALLSGEDFEFDRISSRILHLGYLMLLDELDAPDPANPERPCAARVLEEASAAGFKTSLDMVTDLSPRLQQVVRPVLPYVDYLIVNELEAGALAGVEVREGEKLKRDSFDHLAERVFEFGVRETVVIHMPEGGYWRSRGELNGHWQGSLNVPSDFIKGTAGAGDAFCAAVLYGLHEGWEPVRTLQLAACHAAQSMTDPTTTDGLLPMKSTLELIDRFGFRA